MVTIVPTGRLKNHHLLKLLVTQSFNDIKSKIASSCLHVMLPF